MRKGILFVLSLAFFIAGMWAQGIPRHIPDYSYCGYRHSNRPIPDVDNVVFVSWKEGFQSARIQCAIDYVSSLPMDENGHRGAVLLDKGVFELDAPLRITASGVVLRGMDKEKTCLLKKGVDRGALIYMEGRDDIVFSDTLEVTSPAVPLGARSLQLAGGRMPEVGDRIQILRPSTREWIASIGCHTYGGGHDYWGWKPGDADVVWDREVTEVKGGQITFDAPLTMALDSIWGLAKVMPYTWEGRLEEAGVENLTLLSDYAGDCPMDEEHCWTGVSIGQAENCWVRRVDFRHFAGSAVIVQPTGSLITVEDCRSMAPVSEIGGMRRRTFHTLGQHVLFQRCLSINGIHDFSAGYCAAGPNAFVQCDALDAHGFSGSVDMWACGLLFDIVNIEGNDIRFMNLGPRYNGAGWNTANSMAWQCTASTFYCFSPSPDARNHVYGSWGQCWGNGEWGEMDNHVKPRSLFYAQLERRLGHECKEQARLMPLSTKASSSPTVEAAMNLAQEAYLPRLTLEKWIDKVPYTASVNREGLRSVDELPVSVMADNQTKKTNVKNEKKGTDKRISVPWWGGKLRNPQLRKAVPHITRFVPDREGIGLTDRIDDVLKYMADNHLQALEHNYGLWYDRRRDDHERVRRRYGEVCAPFYEQPFARSGKGKAWDGLSKYDLTRPNLWYWHRLKEFASKAETYGIQLYHHHYFQHNLLEAGAHWVDSPWRTANNVNQTNFPEPVPFAGDKRIFMADMFYDITHPVRRKLHENYIRMCLDQLADCPNVVHFISAEYTGPLHFVRFWLDVIAAWQKETGKKARVALCVTKDVQDAILNDSVRSRLIDMIDIRYWHYHTGGIYAPAGGKHLSPRQHARHQQTGTVTSTEVKKALDEYRKKFPDKVVIYSAQAPTDVIR